MSGDFSLPYWMSTEVLGTVTNLHTLPLPQWLSGFGAQQLTRRTDVGLTLAMAVSLAVAVKRFAVVGEILEA